MQVQITLAPFQMNVTLSNLLNFSEPQNLNICKTEISFVLWAKGVSKTCSSLPTLWGCKNEKWSCLV